MYVMHEGPILTWHTHMDGALSLPEVPRSQSSFVYPKLGGGQYIASISL